MHRMVFVLVFRMCIFLSMAFCCCCFCYHHTYHLRRHTANEYRTMNYGEKRKRNINQRFNVIVSSVGFENGVSVYSIIISRDEKFAITSVRSSPSSLVMSYILCWSLLAWIGLAIHYFSQWRFVFSSPIEHRMLLHTTPYSLYFKYAIDTSNCFVDRTAPI